MARLDPNANMDSYSLGSTSATLMPFVTAMGTDVAFFASGTTAGSKYQLYVTDGTSGGTHAIANGPTFTTDPQASLGQAGSLVYFTANDGQQSEVFVSDGQTIRKLDPNANTDTLSSANGTSGVTAFTGSDGKQYFAFFANNLADGGAVNAPKYELVVSDGTAAGTVAFTNASFANPAFGLTVSGNGVYFTATDGAGNLQAWTANQTGLSRLDPNGNQDSYTSALVSTSTTYSVVASNANKADGTNSTTPYTFTVSRTGYDYGAATLSYQVAVSGANASGLIANPAGTITFAPGVSATTLTVNVNGLPLTAAASFTVTLAGSTNLTGNQSTSTSQVSAPTASGLIGPNVVSSAYSVAATDANKPDGTTGLTPYTFTVSRTGDTSQATTFTYAVAGTGTNPAPASPFANPTGTVSLAAGASSAVLTVNVTGTPVTTAEGFGVTISGDNGSTASASGTIGVNTTNTVAAGSPVYRFYDSSNEGHFFTSNPQEVAQIQATSKVLSLEGPAFMSVNTASDTNAVSVYRFYEAANNSHFYTDSLAEVKQIQATRPDMTLEGPAFSVDPTMQAGDIAVYRLYESRSDTHLYTTSQTEVASIRATRPDIAYEGPAFYVKT